MSMNRRRMEREAREAWARHPASVNTITLHRNRRSARDDRYWRKVARQYAAGRRFKWLPELVVYGLTVTSVDMETGVVTAERSPTSDAEASPGAR